MLGVKNYEALFQEPGVGDKMVVGTWDPFELFKYGLLWARQGRSYEEMGLYLGMSFLEFLRWCLALSTRTTE